MSHRVTVIDYGIGNLFSVRRSLESVGATVTLTGAPQDVASAERLVLPGVGAFADGINGLRERGLADAVLEFAQRQRPLLGICLGMQMFATQSEEFGVHRGLDLIPGRVAPIAAVAIDGQPLKIPNIGWRALQPAPSSGWSNTALASVQPGQAVYLVHSFHLVPTDPAHVLAWCDYGGQRVTAAVARDNVIGCQFHPEKSGVVGQAILARFVGA
jgi:imidazole glycerol-phosphate synthase subunit HisH